MNKRAVLIICLASVISPVFGYAKRGEKKANIKKLNRCSDVAKRVSKAQINEQKNIDTSISVKELESGHLGREYYRALIDRALERHWAIPVTMHYSFGNRSFGGESENCTLSNLVFGKSFTIGDIFLPSKLSRDRKVRVSQSGGGVTLDANNLVPTFQRPNDDATQFGTFGSDQYIGLLAPISVGIETDRDEVGFDVSIIYRFHTGSNEDIYVALGATIPFKSVEHKMDLQLAGGEGLDQLRAGNVGDNVTIGSEMAINQFFDDFSDVEDFLLRGVLGPRCLQFKKRQRKTGIGDINFFTHVDFAARLQQCTRNWVDSALVGINLVIPTGNRDKGNAIWEPILGNGGAFQVDVFGNIIFNGPVKAFNPVFRLIGTFSTRFTNKDLRVAKVRTSEVTGVVNLPTLRDVFPNLSAPINARFGPYFVAAFNEPDSTVPMFADQKIPTCVKYGTKIIFGAGNYAYNVFNLGFRLGLFYEFMHKSEDCVTVKCDPSGLTPGEFDTNALICRTSRRAHTFSWSLTYEFENMVELSFGSLHVFAGKNVPRHRDIFGSLTFVF